MKQVLNVSLKLARLDVSNILILGESGTGKGLLAQFIHKNSKRVNNPFLQINCAALPESLLEAELFGFEKGAFTGAGIKGKIGLLELAQNGTILLDEIGELPLPVQANLLKCLDEHEIMHLGGLKPRENEIRKDESKTGIQDLKGERYV
jgi:transcriptional regulator with PAS, ATPase and Fis domain